MRWESRVTEGGAEEARVALRDRILREDERQGPLDLVVEGEGVEAGRAVGGLRRRRHPATARRVDHPEQLVGEVVWREVAAQSVLERVGDGGLA